jgi:hypothetical protein
MNMRWKEKLNYPFPFYLNDDRKNLLFIAGMGLFVFIFLVFFKTSSNTHLELNTGHKVIFGFVTFASLFVTVFVLPRLFPAIFETDQWTVGKYILHTILNIVIIGIVSTGVDEFLICPERSLWENFKGAVEQVVIVGSIPVALVTLILRSNMLRQNLSQALKANLELEKISAYKKENRPEKAHNNHTIVLRSETNETLSLDLPDLLFIQALDNYSTVHWMNGHGVQKKILRVNLKNLENQINNTYTIRCHRSYIVNVTAIVSVSGNANGYKLRIRDTDFSIPVSRSKGKDIIDKIGQLKDMLQIALSVHPTSLSVHP